MRHPLFAIFAIAIVLLSACGKEYATHQMTEDQAIAQLQSVPMNEGRGAFKKRNQASVQGLFTLLEQLVASGQIKIPQQHQSALSLGGGGLNLSSLSSIFSLLQGGGISSIAGLAGGLSGTTTPSSGMSGIMGLMNAAMPVIAVIAPQYAPIIQAFMVILPLLMSFSKKPAPTASLTMLVPTRA